MLKLLESLTAKLEEVVKYLNELDARVKNLEQKKANECNCFNCPEHNGYID